MAVNEDKKIDNTSAESSPAPSETQPTTLDELRKKFDEQAAIKRASITPGLPPAHAYHLPYQSPHGSYYYVPEKPENEYRSEKDSVTPQSESAPLKGSVPKSDTSQRDMSNLTASFGKLISLGVGILSTGVQIGSKLVNDVSSSQMTGNQMHEGYSPHNPHHSTYHNDCSHMQEQYHHCGCCNCENPGVHQG